MHLGQPSKRAEQREVSSLITWVASFTTYIAIVAEAHPERVRDLLAYMRLIIREAHKHGGHGWLTYDAVFRRNRQASSEPWSVLDPSLHTAYIAGQNLPPRIPCKFCNESDHPSEECALAPLVPSVRASPHVPGSSGTPTFKRPLSATSNPAPKKLCISWNRGQCVFLSQSIR